MSGRRNHTMVGAVFVLVCIATAFAIFLGLKFAPSRDERASGNGAATATVAPDEPVDIGDERQPAPAAVAPVPNDDGATAFQAARLLDQDSFLRTCMAPSSTMAGTIDDKDRAAWCGCLHAQLVRLNADGEQRVDQEWTSVSNFCETEMGRDPDGFRAYFTPGGKRDDAQEDSSSVDPSRPPL